jgi:hypothetical protein
MAVDDNGLRRLSELYALREDCLATNPFPPLFRVSACSSEAYANVIPSEVAGDDLLLVPEGTKAIGNSASMFLHPGGGISQQEESNWEEFTKKGILKVIRVKLIQPDRENVEGWVMDEELARTRKL